MSEITFIVAGTAKRESIERALYGGSEITSWTQGPDNGFVAEITSDDITRADYQIGRLRSFGTFWVGEPGANADLDWLLSRYGGLTPLEIEVARFKRAGRLEIISVKP